MEQERLKIVTGQPERQPIKTTRAVLVLGVAPSVAELRGYQAVCVLGWGLVPRGWPGGTQGNQDSGCLIKFKNDC